MNNREQFESTMLMRGYDHSFYRPALDKWDNAIWQDNWVTWQAAQAQSAKRLKVAEEALEVIGRQHLIAELDKETAVYGDFRDCNDQLINIARKALQILAEGK